MAGKIFWAIASGTLTLTLSPFVASWTFTCRYFSAGAGAAGTGRAVSVATSKQTTTAICVRFRMVSLIGVGLLCPSCQLIRREPWKCFSRGRAEPDNQHRRFLRVELAARYIQERFRDCVSRRFAQQKRRGTLRPE